MQSRRTQRLPRSPELPTNRGTTLQMKGQILRLRPQSGFRQQWVPASLKTVNSVQATLLLNRIPLLKLPPRLQEKGVQKATPTHPRKKTQIAYQVPLQLPPQAFLPQMAALGAFHPGWVPPPPTPGAVWGCPVPPGLCAGGNNILTRGLPPPLLIQHPFLGPATALVIPAAKPAAKPAAQNPHITNNNNANSFSKRSELPISMLASSTIAPMVPCSSSQPQSAHGNKAQLENNLNMNALLSQTESEMQPNFDFDNTDLDIDLEELDSLFYNPGEVVDGEMDALQQLLECDAGGLGNLNRNCSFGNLESLG
eukprot:TRINITY_DN3924_c0_g1_i3.p6 TRINITY_DN3924_c0_g1~~TRINITY_DN3924_c0_g1_i3.p6  ORF type:complete len:310 (-),score=36.75 TRINITY_DN3924_c0_g1_i3:3349-4278(-)